MIPINVGWNVVACQGVNARPGVEYYAVGCAAEPLRVSKWVLFIELKILELHHEGDRFMLRVESPLMRM